MREYTTNDVEKIKHNISVAGERGKILKAYYDFLNEKTYYKNILNNSKRMSKCMDYWRWDKYEKNKLLDLQVVSRCKSRFCPNCVKVSNGKAYHKFKPQFEKLKSYGYIPLFLTLTVPNVNSFDLKNTLTNMQKSFTKLFRWFNSVDDKVYFKKRLFVLKAALRSLEITYNATYNTYHPHYHIILFIDKNINNYDMLRHIKTGLYKNNEEILYSNIEFQISQLWTMSFNNVSIKKYIENDTLYDEDKNLKYYLVNLEDIDFDKGMLELFKYTFKDIEFKNSCTSFEDNPFIIYFNALSGKRLRQGYGLLYGMDFDCENAEMEKENDSILDYLEFEESPTRAVIDVNDLETVYHDYKKISRFKHNFIED